MKYKRTKGLLIILIVTIIIALIFNKYNYLLKTNTINISQKEEKKFSSTISMMYETDAGSGIYVETNESSWPSSGYTFNANLSKCENGGTLTWDETNKKVLMSSNTSDKCYVYFDLVLPTLAEACAGQNIASCIKSNYQLDSNILLHNSILTNGANDGSYRYTGKNPNNYVCFDNGCTEDKLYRIVGVFDNQIKVVKHEYGTTSELGTQNMTSKTFQKTDYPDYNGIYNSIPRYDWQNHKSNLAMLTNNINQLKNEIAIPPITCGEAEYNVSSLNLDTLNATFLNYLGSLTNKIAMHTWYYYSNTNLKDVTPYNAYKYEVGAEKVLSKNYDNKIGLLYINEYLYAFPYEYWQKTNFSDIKYENWIYRGIPELLNTSFENNGGMYSTHMAYIDKDGNIGSGDCNEAAYPNGTLLSSVALRPAFYLNTNISLISGAGTQSDPYRIS